MISGFLRDPAREPIQDLYELKLIVKVVFKPQDYLFVVVETGDCFVSPRKRNLRERHVEKLREEPFPNPAQFLERQTARNRPVVQDVVPTDHLARKPGLGDRDRFAIGYVEHSQQGCKSRDRPSRSVGIWSPRLIRPRSLVLSSNRQARGRAAS